MSLRKLLKAEAARNRLFAGFASELLYCKLSLTGSLHGDDILETLDTFLDPAQKADPRYLRRLKRDMLFCRLYYRIINREYFLYHFEDLSRRGREQYIGAFELKDAFREINKVGCPEIIDEKAKTYEFYSDYFQRDAQLIQRRADKDKLEQFLKKHSPCLLKPLKQYGGKGIKKISSEEVLESDASCESILRLAPFLLEEILEQDPEIARFHPQSINTVRYVTFYHEGKLTRILAALRMGRHGSFVDNASSGGVYSLIDLETGTLITPARSDAGEEFLFHPDTGIQVLGSKVSKWEELNALVERIVQVLPQQKLVGWDFALTPKGWALIEGNTMPAIQSFNWDHGMRDELAEVIGKVVPLRRF